MNWFYLISGLLTVLIAVAHAIWGEKQIIPELKESKLSELTEAGFYISYHQITITLLVSGIALVIASMLDNTVGIILAFFVLIIIIGNISVFIAISLSKYKSAFSQTVPQIIIYSIMVLLIILGLFL